MFFCKVGYFKYMATVSNCQIKSQLAIWLSTVTSVFRPGGCQLVNIHDSDVQLKCMQDHSLIYFGLFMKSTDTEKKNNITSFMDVIKPVILSNFLKFSSMWSHSMTMQLLEFGAAIATKMSSLKEKMSADMDWMGMDWWRTKSVRCGQKQKLLVCWLSENTKIYILTASVTFQCFEKPHSCSQGY